MITEYFVCSGSDPEELQETVNEAIKNGWQPLGGVAVAVSIEKIKGEYHTSSGGGEFRAIVAEESQLLCQAIVRMAAD